MRGWEWNLTEVIVGSAEESFGEGLKTAPGRQVWKELGNGMWASITYDAAGLHHEDTKFTKKGRGQVGEPRAGGLRMIGVMTPALNHKGTKDTKN